MENHKGNSENEFNKQIARRKNKRLADNKKGIDYLNKKARFYQMEFNKLKRMTKEERAIFFKKY